jgi:putative transposase
MRYSIILPLIEAKNGDKSKIVKEIAAKSYVNPVKKKNFTISERQIYRLYAKYKKYKFNGLKPVTNKNKGTHPKISQDVINMILELKKELPSRSAYKIITMLELAKIVPKNYLNIRTINRILKQYNYTRKLLSKNNKVYTKNEKDYINQLWISDVTDGIYVDFDNNTKKKTYLIGFLDDCSRRVTHAEFYLDSTLPKLEDCLKKAITKSGIPDAIYVDNGNIYISNHFKLICAKLDVKLIYSTRFYPQGKGKCERIWDTIQKSFMSEAIASNSVNSITYLNDIFFPWLQLEYQDKIHSEIKMTPTEKWNLSVKSGRTLRYMAPLEIDEIFLRQDFRKVNTYGIINFEGNTYEGPGSLVGHKVIIKYDPFDLSQIKVYHNDKFMGFAKIVNIKNTRHKDVIDVILEPKNTSPISKMYFENLSLEYQKYLNTQIDLSLNKSEITNAKQILPTKSDSPLVPLKDKSYSISKDSFIKIVQSITKIDVFSYPEKSELLILWDTLKSFDPDIFKEILSDFKDNHLDFNKNFIFYLQQISSIYSKKVNSISK